MEHARETPPPEASTLEYAQYIISEMEEKSPVYADPIWPDVNKKTLDVLIAKLNTLRNRGLVFTKEVLDYIVWPDVEEGKSDPEFAGWPEYEDLSDFLDVLGGWS